MRLKQRMCGIWGNCITLKIMLIVINMVCAKSHVLFVEKGLFSIQAQALIKCWPSTLGSGREVLTEWIRRFGSTDRNIRPENVQALLSGMHIPQAQVGAMLECAKDIRERGNLRYESYYNITPPQLKRSHGNTRLIAKSFDRNGQEKKKRPRKMSNKSKRSVGRDVFLGGSCNPTTWRRDVAIPLLEKKGITYYNPQVAEWTEELVAVEHNAKASASVLLYVLDRRTRNVVGIVEVANFAGSKREVVLVTDPYKQGEPVAGENISQAEYEELCSGLSTLQDLVARQGISVHRNITEAIRSTEKILSNNTNSRRKTSLKLPNGLSQDITIKKHGDFSHLSDMCLYYLNPTNKTTTDLNGISSKAETADSIKINIEQLCTAVNDGKIQNRTTDMYRRCCHGVLSMYDMYIGGSCFDNEWKDSIALPLLRESKLKFVFATCGSVKSSRATEKEVAAMENSKVLLFVITNRTRGLETMALASYFIGCCRNVILCIQHLPETAIIGDEKLSKVAIKDYNRGRVYLSDLASRSGVPVYENVADAVQAAISRSRTSPTTTR